MSTKIHFAWHTGKSVPIFQLVQLANQVKDIQKATRAKDVAESVLYSLRPWLDSAFEFFANNGEDECAVLIGRVVYPVMQRNAWKATWVFPSGERETLESELRQNLKGKYVPNWKESMNDLQALCEGIYEFSLQSHPSLCFLSAPDGTDVYVKSFGLTKEAVNFLDSQYRRFDFTDACDMGEEDFPELADEAKTAADKDEFFSRAQTERGNLWDAALNGHHIWKNAGLTFSLDDVYDRAEKVSELRNVAKIIFNEVKGAKLS